MTLDPSKLTKEQLAALSPMGLMMYHTQGRMRPARHQEYVDKAILELVYGDVDILLVMLPPGHSKSTQGSKYTPAWYLGTFPERQVMLVSYGTDFAASWGGQARDVMRETGNKVFGVTVDPNRKSEVEWWLRGKQGRMYSQGLDGQVTGKRAHLLIGDDMYKNSGDAQSETYRQLVIDFMQDVAFGRLHTGGKMLFLNYRWNLRDIHAWIIERAEVAGLRSRVIRLPAIAEEDDEIGRAPGEPLWPELYPLDNLLMRQAAVGGESSPTWLAQYQQDPAPPSGSLLLAHWWRYWGPEEPKVTERWLSVDCALKDTKDSDFVVNQCWGILGDQYYLLDQDRRRMDFVATTDSIETMAAKHKPRYVMVEDKANGPAVIRALRQKISGLVPVNPLGGKVSRAQAVSGLVEDGRVFVPRPDDMPWVNAFISECSSFPRGANDDQVDAFSQALMRFAGSTARVTEEATEEEVQPRKHAWMFRRKEKPGRAPHFGPGLDDAAVWEAMG